MNIYDSYVISAPVRLQEWHAQEVLRARRLLGRCRAGYAYYIEYIPNFPAPRLPLLTRHQSELFPLSPLPVLLH